MGRFAIHCPDDESIKDAKDFFTNLLGGSIVRNNRDEIETRNGDIVMFIKNAQMQTHGCKLEDFLVLSNRKDEYDYKQLKMCTLG